MITALSAAFQNVITGMQAIADEMHASERIEQYRSDCEARLPGYLEAADARAAEDAEEFWRNDPGRNMKTPADRQQMINEVQEEYRRKARRKIQREIDNSRSQLSAEHAILYAIELLKKNWKVTPDAFELVVDALRLAPAPVLDDDAREAISRGYTADGPDAAKKAIEQASNERAAEEKRAAEDAEAQRIAALEAEREQIAHAIERQQEPHKRLAEIQKELATASA